MYSQLLQEMKFHAILRKAYCTYKNENEVFSFHKYLHYIKRYTSAKLHDRIVGRYHSLIIQTLFIIICVIIIYILNNLHISSDF